MCKTSLLTVFTLLSAVSGRIVTVNAVTTAADVTLTSSNEVVTVTNQETSWLSTTIFEATTSVLTIPTGVVNTESLSSKSNPVKTAKTLSTSALTQSIDPNTYSGSYTVVTSAPTEAVPESSSSNSVASSSPSSSFETPSASLASSSVSSSSSPVASLVSPSTTSTSSTPSTVASTSSTTSTSSTPSTVASTSSTTSTSSTPSTVASTSSTTSSTSSTVAPTSSASTSPTSFVISSSNSKSAVVSTEVTMSTSTSTVPVSISSSASSSSPSASSVITSSSTSSTSKSISTTVRSTGESSLVISSSQSFSSSITSSLTTSSTSSFSTSSPSTSSTTTVSTTSTTSSASKTSAAAGTAKYSGPIFGVIDKSAPPDMFPREDLKITMPSGYDSSQICQTNKFYDNFILGNTNLTSFAQPYGVFYSNDANYYGVGISYTNVSQRLFGPDASKDPVEYYTNPTMLKSLVLSAKEFTNSNIQPISIDAMGPFSVNVTLKTYNNWPNQKLVVPLTLGSGFVTGIYDGYTPRLFSQIGISKIVKVISSDCISGLQKFEVSLMNGVQWNVYVNAPSGFEFKPISDFEFMGNFAASGSSSIVVQIAVVTSNEKSIDSAAGAFPIGAHIDGETTGSVTTYRIAYEVAGNSKTGTTLLYALPHHVSSFSDETKNAVVSGLTAYSTSKGYLTGVLANALEMQESVADVPSWISGKTSILSSSTLKLLAETVNDELSEDISSQLDPTSTYGAGKTFDKFAYICLVAADVLQNEAVAKQGLQRLKTAFAPYTQNKQSVNLMYDTLLKGITSTGANRDGGGPMSDYGSPYYNDHHFHYGYLIHTAAVIGYLDSTYGSNTWVSENRDWVNSLVRDVANPSSDDTYFPVFRSFDFYSGHSWAHGMFESGDGKDEESTSEDYNFAYGMKLWGKISNDQEMEARGDLMLAIMKRTMNDYFYFKNDNAIQPANILGNRVAGISFENKLDHTTYFGTNLEYIQGIHMIPVTPASALIRDSEFVSQEWNSLLAPMVDNLDSGWAGILRANQALFDAKSSYNYFASDNFKSAYLDQGASRSWYIAFAALQGGAN